MYAVIQDRNRQYRATQGEKLTLDRNEALEVGATFEVPILLLSDESGIRVGAPFVAGAKAVCKVLSHARGPKGILGKYKRRKHSHRRRGYRAEQTLVEVVAISA
jgi:large subunit ribosomal protein L21